MSTEAKPHPAKAALDEWTARNTNRSVIERANGVTRELLTFVEAQTQRAFLDAWHACERYHGLKR